jgi:two-component system, NtrC family, sensor kinase
VTDVGHDTRLAIAAHIDEESEGSLNRAYDLGRHALAKGLGILDILSLYDSAQKELVLSAPPGDRSRIGAAVGDFFRELLSPFEMSFRGYKEANGNLKRLNAEIQTAYAELQTRQSQLIQAAKMASLGELVAGIAHEINNPLSFVTSHLATAGKSVGKVEKELGESASATVKQNCERARSRLLESELGTRRIGELVLKLRTFSRLDEGEQKRVSIRECVASVLTILEHRVKGRIVVETHFGYPDSVECFPGLMNQALMNLISNGIDAIQGEGTITVNTGADADGYVIAVSDTGNGIPPHLLERVLDPFFTTKPVGEGTGLGLSITYSIAQKHKGTLTLRPREGGGTVATIRFPLDLRGASASGDVCSIPS